MVINNDATRRNALYSARGVIVRNGNFDGSAVTPQRMLGSPENVNLAQTLNGQPLLNNAKQGIVLIRVGDKAPEVKILSFAHAVDIENVTPAETVIAVNNAVIDGIACTIDNETGAANITASSPDTVCVQIFGWLAGALGFGGGKPFRSLGCFLYDGMTFADIVGLTTAKQAAEENTVSLANGYDGGTTDIVIRGGRTGEQLTWNIRNKDEILLQMAEGGRMSQSDSGSIRYNHPMNGDDVGDRTVELWGFYPQYEDGQRQTSDEESFIRVKHYRKGTLTPQDDSEGGSTIATIGFVYDTPAAYYDPDYGQIPNPDIDKMSLSDWRNWKLKDCVIRGLSAGRVIVRPASGVSVGSSQINMVKGQIAYNKIGTTPPNASGFAVSFSPSSIGLVLEYDTDKRQIRITAGQTAGTETVTVTLTNGDAGGTLISTTFSVTVA